MEDDNMKHMDQNFLVILLGILLGLLIAGCRTITRTEYVPVESKVIETVTVHDTAVIASLPLVHDTIVTPDTVSYLCNQFAFSWVKLQDGLLSHSLGIFPGASLIVKVPQYEVRERYVEKPVVQTKEVEVEKELTLWQKFKIYAGETLLLLVVGLAGYIFFVKIKKGGIL